MLPDDGDMSPGFSCRDLAGINEDESIRIGVNQQQPTVVRQGQDAILPPGQAAVFAEGTVGDPSDFPVP